MTDETLNHEHALRQDQPPLRPDYKRPLPLLTPISWLHQGIKDTFTNPFTSLFYGLMIGLVSALVLLQLAALGMDYILLPALSGFMVVGPAIAVGLYEKSRILSLGQETTLRHMLLFRGKSTGQILLIGVMLMMVVVLWLRAAFLLYALFFGMLPFPGAAEIFEIIFTTPRGWSLLSVGSLVGGLFAAFAFAISAFSIPMVLNEDKDAFTAMGISWSISWANKGIAVVWGGIILVLFALSLATALIGLIIIFPILGHGTWHAYIAMRGDEATSAKSAKP